MTLTLDRDGERLDSALSRLVPELTRSQAQRLIEQGAVTQAGRPVKKNEKLPAGTAMLKYSPPSEKKLRPRRPRPAVCRSASTMNRRFCSDSAKNISFAVRLVEHSSS